MNLKRKDADVKTVQPLTQPLWWKQTGWPTKYFLGRAFISQRTFNIIKFFILLYLKSPLLPREPTLIYTMPGHLNTCQYQKLTDKVCFWIIMMKPPIHFSILSLSHAQWNPMLTAQCYLGSRRIPRKGAFLDALANSLGRSSKLQLPCPDLAGPTLS